MKKSLQLITSIFLICTSLLHGQTDKLSPVLFKNAPVLFKEGNKSFQQVLAFCKYEKDGKIVFKASGREMKADLKKGNNTFLLTVPSVTKPEKISIYVRRDNLAAEKYNVQISPAKKWEIYLVQHTHTDIGYTRSQDEVINDHLQYIDMALDYCDQTDMYPDAAKFRWTCEASWVTLRYLRTRPKSQIDRLKKRIAEGRIEVTGMYLNMSEITDENIMYDFLQPLKEFQNEGIPVCTAMQNDVNGVAWCLPDYFKNTGVKYLSMGINETRSVLPFDKPTCFWWESPSGERLLAFNSNHYMTGNDFGFHTNAINVEKMLDHLASLEEKHYLFNAIAIPFQGYHIDNAAPSTIACRLVKQWNEKYEYPKLRLALAREFLEYVEKNHSEALPVHRTAWPDWWTDGCGTSSRETAEIRKTQNLKQVNEGLLSMVSMLGGKLDPLSEKKTEHIDENIIFFDEHTWGASESTTMPFSENTTRQWLIKGAYSWEALKGASILNNEAMARLSSLFKKAGFPLIYVINTLGWPRSGHAEVFINYEILPKDMKFRIIDLSSGKEVPCQFLRSRREGAYWMLEVSGIPALGSKAMKIQLSDLPEPDKIAENSFTETMENQFYKISIDRNTGTIQSLFDKELNLELIDIQSKYNIGQPVRETLPDRKEMTPSHSTISNVKIEKGTNETIWESLKICADLDGFKKGNENKPEGIEWEIRLYKNIKKVELRYSARKDIITTPEALYVSFPFSLPDSRIVFETIGGILSQGQQLPGSASDWNAAQNFVSVRGKKAQIVLVSNEIPLWQFSDLNIGKFERKPKAGKTSLYSWVMNNYWYTNFRAFQEGDFSWGYQITSSQDTTNVFATRFAIGERTIFPEKVFPAGTGEFQSPVLETIKIKGSDNAILINARPVFSEPGTILLHFRELEGRKADIQLESKIPDNPINQMIEVNVTGNPIGKPVHTVQINSFEVKFIKVKLDH